MYEAHWQLEHKPFDNGADLRLYYPSEAHHGALLKLRYAVESRRGAALLAGAAGTGKTLLVRMLARQLPEQYDPFVHLVFPQMPAADLLAYLAVQMGIERSEVGTSIGESVSRIDRRLSENAAQGKHAVLAIDDAQLLDGGTLETMRLLMNFELAAEPVLTLLLVGQPSLLPQMERMPQFDERLGVKSLLRPLTIEETMSYVEHRLKAAGAVQQVFEAAALEAMFRATQGIPRRINRLCDLALLIGFAEERSSIGAVQIDAVAHELLAVAPE